MKLPFSILPLLIIISVLAACKEDVKSEAELEVAEEVIAEEPKQNTEKKEAISQANSVMARVMSTKECMSFARYIVSAEVSDQLMKEEGPYTLFAPSDDAFNSMDEESVKKLPMTENKPLLVSMVKSHIVEGTYDSVTLIQALKKGAVSLTTISGEQLTVSKKDNDILVTDSKGNIATVGKSDIQANNGVVHVVNLVLGMD
ncbi:MAG: fasciclin domain-containing protein [Flavobacteriaceae bacterium]|nr:fasciclin domain-containing protein [Flavobacteriaceae bacterium]